MTAVLACSGGVDIPLRGSAFGGSAGSGQGGTAGSTAGGAGTSSAGTGNVLVIPPDGGDEACTPLSCQPIGGQYCGKVGDGCGSTEDCGSCTQPDWVCEDGLCKGGPNCLARSSCTEGSATYCGIIGDECGGGLDCGDCVAPEVCGGTGVDHVCGDPACVPLSCPLPVGQYCGVIGDGCGHALDCGSCPGGAVCGGDGIPGVCPGSEVSGGCTGIKCNVETCDAGGPTSVSGVVYDPAGVNPLYNVRVYVPNAALDPIPTGASCEQCNATLSGQPIVTTLTDAAGRFKLDGVPSGNDIPLVMQVGRWRRQITIPNVVGCTDNLLDDPQLTRLPRNQSEGDIPHIAITTGSADALECLIPRIGLDRAEVTTDTGTGRVHLYAGGIPGGRGQGATSMTPGVTLPSAETLWADPQKMRGYDIVMFSCEGGEAQPLKDPYLANFQDYIDNGGRAFLTHFHYYWLNHGSPALQGTADYIGNGPNPPNPAIGMINTGFPKGIALADWLVNVGASTVRGELPIYESRNSVVSAIAPTQDWITIPMNPAANNQPALQYLTFNTPVGVPPAQQCGRVVDTDLHIGAAVGQGPTAQGGDRSAPNTPYPNGCSASPMSPQIKALEFIFFDLAACLQPDTVQPVPPDPPPATAVPPPPAPVPPPPPPPPPR